MQDAALTNQSVFLNKKFLVGFILWRSYGARSAARSWTPTEIYKTISLQA